jgi:2-dehydropantoate 2-reductase
MKSPAMRFLIAGAGAIGAYIGARMAQAGFDVTLFARGPHLRAMQERGVQVKSGEGDFVARPTIAGSLSDVGPVDVVFLGVKAHGLPQLAPQLKPVLGPDTTVVSTQNGIPWWYFQGFGGEWEGLHLERVDPGGVISSAIEARRVVGSIVYLATEITAPGVIQHIEGNRISLGEPDGTRSDRSRRIAEALIASGLRCPITTRLRHEIWVKALGNASLNPVSALTRATVVQMVRDPGVCSVIRNIMQEVEAVAHKLGMELPVSIDQRIAGAEKVGEHKTSMLQDLEAGRPMELEALVGAVVELGERVGLPMSCTRTVYNCTKLLAESYSVPPKASAPLDAVAR